MERCSDARGVEELNAVETILCQWHNLRPPYRRGIAIRRTENVPQAVPHIIRSLPDVFEDWQCFAMSFVRRHPPQAVFPSTRAHRDNRLPLKRTHYIS
jgi:hypothetical protein